MRDHSASLNLWWHLTFPYLTNTWNYKPEMGIGLVICCYEHDGCVPLSLILGGSSWSPGDIFRLFLGLLY